MGEVRGDMSAGPTRKRFPSPAGGRAPVQARGAGWLLLLAACLLPATGRASEAADVVRRWMVATMADGSPIGVIARIGDTVYPNATIVSAHEKGIHLQAGGTDVEFPWQILGDDG